MGAVRQTSEIASRYPRHFLQSLQSAGRLAQSELAGSLQPSGLAIACSCRYNICRCITGVCSWRRNTRGTKLRPNMATTAITRDEFLKDRQGRTFADVVNDAGQPFGTVLEFFSSADRQRRMEESEIHHDRAPMAGVVREFEALPEIHKFLGTLQAQRNQRLRQAIGVLVRMIMERRGWKKTGKKGSLGVRSSKSTRHAQPQHRRLGILVCPRRAVPARARQAVSVRAQALPRARIRLRPSRAPAANGHAGNGRSAKGSSPTRRTTKRRPGAT